MTRSHPRAGGRARALVACLLLLAACTLAYGSNVPQPGNTGANGDDRACETGSPIALMECVEAARYDADLSFVATPRSPGSAHHRVVRDWCARRLSKLGYEVERHDYGSGVNVIGRLHGGSLARQQVLIAAHYDHIPGCPGADDNGSGVAGLLEIARVLAQARYERTLVIAFWDEEERGMLGSTAYAQRAHTRGEEIAANFTFEMIGVYRDQHNSQKLPDAFEMLYPEQIARLEAEGFRGDFLAVAFDERHSQPHAEALGHLGALIGLKTVPLKLTDELKNSPLVPDLRRSDHAPFWALDYPGIMLTDTSEFRYPPYHCRQERDTTEKLNTPFTIQVLQATLGTAAQLLELR